MVRLREVFSRHCKPILSPHLSFNLPVSASGFFAIAASSLAVAAAVYLGVDLTYIHSNFLPLAVASFLISTLLSVYLYARSRYAPPAELALGGNSGKGQEFRSRAPPQRRCLWFTFSSAAMVSLFSPRVPPGNVAYDFFKGRELNPRIKDFDLKFFCEMRPGLIGWVSRQPLSRTSTRSIMAVQVLYFQSQRLIADWRLMVHRAGPVRHTVILWPCVELIFLTSAMWNGF